ncbi:MAG: helix-turn-helix domain-containing protein [Acidimicrobiales bacterium]
MPDPVKRPYDNSAREAASAATRRRVLDAARDLLVERGYRRTTVAAIAERAGVHTDTIYALVGRKPVVLRELIEQAVSGTDRAVTAEERDEVRALKAEPDAGRKLAIYAGAVRAIQERLAPLFLALRDASDTDAEARQVWEEIGRRRAANMRKLALELQGTGRLRPGLSIDEAADTIWATNSSELYVLLTVDRGWSPERFERWLADLWQRQLLG